MSAPDTNIETQKENHRPPLLGIKGAMIFGGLMLLGVVIFALMNGSEPSADTLIGTETTVQPSN
ncbi:hypothetical protein JQV19_11875 [Sulfitobacter mediterraneus]|uniref:hypothetical protein n=1 Tax=Sulfitobacter mediterraneus TaxID=83219 RepID=UPI00193A3975|nr:hypothetical protein [Sulfitobacter mediterraneus]MBM1557340.1 hypothetical protein [Sulfitobacter mediterraneus]MBM1568386.1 hypothetical protein [Sulfitobacter mediterraneus]MBM1572011.1 hypothetical protein [Sulfitobacter mediterraneus]MBM1575800.1 hypothetical protein [Sulfitobacter mediterraneus]MBM1580122.1 hypothetical protein [Sulfitobacter mediterraneus]